VQTTSIATSVSDPELYTELLRPENCRFMFTSGGVFEADYRRVDLAHCRMQAGAETLPRICEGAICDGRHVLTIQLRPGPPLYVCGAEIDAEAVGMLGGLSREFCLRLAGPSQWASVSMARDDWAHFGTVLAGREPRFDAFRYVHAPDGAAVAKLRRTLCSAAQLAAETPELLTNPDVARRLDSSLIEAAIDCVVPLEDAKTLVGPREHARIIRQFIALVEQNAQGSLYLPEVCTALGVSARTFRQCCHDYFGIGPKRYLTLRRLYLAREALLNAKPGEDTVTSIATRCGFWELGRFSVAYHNLFDETPVATLRRKALPKAQAISPRGETPSAARVVAV
jgi:AraC-like DNA-binding protein